ncbi:MAG: 50S ribosomal protein L17 [Myxococcota bacterium]
MRHLNKGRNLSRGTAHRKAMLRNMATSLFEHGKIETTDAKAKELRGVVDRLVTLAKQDTLHAKRQAAGFIRTRDVLVKLFDVIAPGFAERHGGYTRIIKVRTRHGDAAPMSLIELMPAGAPVGKSARGPAAPAVKKAVVPESKERFDKK